MRQGREPASARCPLKVRQWDNKGERMHTEFGGTQRIAVSLDKAWEYLVDIRKVAACVPGVQDVKEQGPEHWRAHILTSISLLKVRFTLDITRPELQPRERMTIVIHGKAPGNSVEVAGRIRLEAVGAEQTLLHWNADVHVTGALAAVGGRVVQAAGEQLTADYFACLKAHLEGATTAEASQ